MTPAISAAQVAERLSRLPGIQPRSLQPLSGGMIASVYRVALQDGRELVVKIGGADSRLDIEGDMLRHLALVSELPLPPLLYSAPDLLLLGFVPGTSELDAAAQEHAAELLAALHSLTWSHFGHAQDTLIGPLHQPNPPGAGWLEFFREQRLLYMARQAFEADAISAALFARIEALAARLERWLHEPERPALIHGDIWATNLLARDGRITAFLDPAIYYAHEEIELAYMTLFGSRGLTFGKPFFDRYHALRPIAPGFFEQRRHLYNLYPLLVHARIFGGRYPAEIDRALRRFESGYYA